MPITDLFNNPLSFLLRLLFMIPVILLSLSVHELAHGYTSYKLGDPTAKYDGRLSLNPLRHIDPFGFIALIFVGFGWAKPVQIDPRYYKNPKRGMAITALAGPVSNFAMAFVACFALYAIDAFSETGAIGFYTLYYYIYEGVKITSSVSVAGIFAMLLWLFVSVNIGLGVFNLIPIPPLDGSKILYSFLPNRWLYKIVPYERYFSLILVALLLLGVLDKPISTCVRVIYEAFMVLPGMIFGGAA